MLRLWTIVGTIADICLYCGVRDHRSKDCPARPRVLSPRARRLLGRMTSAQMTLSQLEQEISVIFTEDFGIHQEQIEARFLDHPLRQALEVVSVDPELQARAAEEHWGD